MGQTNGEYGAADGLLRSVGLQKTNGPQRKCEVAAGLSGASIRVIPGIAVQSFSEWLESSGFVQHLETKGGLIRTLLNG